MKKSELKELIKECLNEVELNEATHYYQIPTNVIGNQLYTLKDEISNVYDTVSKGNDYPYQRVSDVIKKLQWIQNKAKLFKVGEKPDSGYGK